jgi:hypothetical protein
MKPETKSFKNNEDYMSNFQKFNDTDIYGQHDNLIHGKLFIKIFNSLYNIYNIYTSQNIDNEKLIEGLKTKYCLTDKHILRNDYINNTDKKKITESMPFKTFVILKYGLAVGIELSDISIYYNSTISRTEVFEIAVFTEEFKRHYEPKKEFYMIVKGSRELELQNFEMRDYNVDIEHNYNDDFKNINGIITGTLNEMRKNGIILLHGNYGSGKTYYIRYLINTIKRKFIYLPLNMVDCISAPEFIPFISKFKDCVLVLEDCEKLLTHRDEGNFNANALSNLLNLGDGLLSDAFSINIICSFNSNLKKIDDALLRKGRLIARYEFKELEIPKAQALADKLEKNITVEKPMTLTDIYNAESMKFENKKANKIGFAYA